MNLTVTALEELTVLAKQYSDLRKEVAGRVQLLNDEVAVAHRRKMSGIKNALAEAKEAQDRLAAAIQAHPELFERPRTFSVHGIKIGLQKGKGSLTWEDDERVVKAIKKHFAQDAIETLIITTEKPSKDALANLPADELKKLGVQIEAAGDFVVIKPVDGAVDKLVKALLEEGARVAEVES